MQHESSPIVSDREQDGARRLRADGADAERAEAGALQASGASDGLVYVSGAFRPSADAAVSVFDHGLLYGDGVFEGIRAYNGRVFRLERHIERLFDSAKAIRLSIPHTQAEVCEIVVETGRRNANHDVHS